MYITYTQHWYDNHLIEADQVLQYLDEITFSTMNELHGIQ